LLISERYLTLELLN